MCRSRSQCIDYWKWFLAHNCFPFTFTIIKLLTHIPFKSRICLHDIGGKTWGVWIGCRGGGGVFVLLGQPHSSLYDFTHFSKTFILVITFKPEDIGLSHFRCIPCNKTFHMVPYFLLWTVTFFWLGWVVLRIYIAYAIFQPYCDFDARDTQSLIS